MAHADLTQVDSHYEFGKNWASFSGHIDESRIEAAMTDLRRILAVESLEGKSFLDIGCGSGLNLVAAARLGAARLVGIDIDPASVETAISIVAKWAPDAETTIQVASILDGPDLPGAPFDVVYSWGVLHHTGAMWAAMDAAVMFVAPDGCFAFALYQKTPYDAFWKLEKRIYSRAPRGVRSTFRALFKGTFAVGLALRGRSLRTYRASYKGRRGMDWGHDVDDWLGGYPYETASPVEIQHWSAANGFSSVCITPTARRPLACILGTPCIEYRASWGQATS